MPKTPALLRDLAGRAASWLGRAAARGRRPTSTVKADRFDLATWTETREASAELDHLQYELGARFHYAADLLGDVFAAAYKVAPELRGRDEIDPSRELNRQVVEHLLASPRLADLREHTVGDAWASGMAVLASESALRNLLERTKDAQEAGRAAAAREAEARAAAQALDEDLNAAAAAAGDDGTVPDEQAEKVESAIALAEATADNAAAAARAAADARKAAEPALRAAIHQALTDATEEAADDAAAARAWGIEPGQLRRMDFAARADLAARLAGSRLARFVDLIGRFRRMAEAKRARHIEGAPGELVGVALGDDLARLVPAETANLAHPALRAAWAARFAESQLMLFHSRGTDRAGQGAVIVCVDCSGSMSSGHGSSATGEAWAKGLALALLDQAQAQRRDYTAILFSSASEIAVFDFPAAERPDVARVVEMTSCFFGGGTDFQQPLTTAAERLAAEHEATGKARGDIVFITDGVADVDPDWVEAWRQTKHELGFRVFGVGIGDAEDYGPGSVLDHLADNTRAIEDLSDTAAAADLFTAI